MRFSKRHVSAIKRRIERSLIRTDNTFASLARKAGVSRQSIHKKFHGGLDTPEKVQYFASLLDTPYEELCLFGVENEAVQGSDSFESENE